MRAFLDIVVPLARLIALVGGLFITGCVMVAVVTYFCNHADAQPNRRR